MFHEKRMGSWVALGATLAFVAATCGQINISNLTDRATYTDQRTFQIVPQAGHTYSAALDGSPVPVGQAIRVDHADYHELAVTATPAGGGAPVAALVRFIVRASERGDTEDGLTTWTPYPVIDSAAAELAGTHLEIIVPVAFPTGLEIPVVAWIKSAQGHVVRGNGWLAASGHPSIRVRRGLGSGFLAATHPAGALNYTAQLAGLSVSKSILVEGNTTWTPVSGTISGNTTWGEDSRIAVTGNTTIPAGSTLTILDGSVIRLNAGVNITNLGRIVIAGAAGRPVVFTPTSRQQPWGGFFLTATTSRLDASGTIFVSAGAVQSGFPGHRSEQPLFYLDNRARVALTNCAAIYLAGQFHHSIDRGQPYASVTVVGTLIQRCTTAGEFNGCSLSFLRSAFIEAPYEDQFFCADPDCDHDGFYLNQGVHELRDSLVGWVKDDCIDAGSGGGPSTVVVSNCWIEAAYHEGLAWSGGGRQTRTYNTVLINCGQGLECGWSSGTSSPLCYAGGILSLGNVVGARYGDNYQGTTGLGLKNGFLVVTNSLLLYNYRDVWGRVWDDTWNYRVNNMDIHDNFLSAPNTNHPNNSVWNPSTDAGRLTAFMTTSSEAPVGVGLAVWSGQVTLADLTNGIPVRLSSFTPHEVSVDYAVETPSSELDSGRLTFQPGETVKRFYPQSAGLQGQPLWRVILRSPAGGEITARSSIYSLAVPPDPTPTNTILIPPGAVWKYLDTGVDQLSAWRALDFNDTGWPSGRAQLGFGENDQATTISSNRQITTYFRHRFTVADRSAFANLSMWMLRDDAGVVFLNGTEVYRSPNLPAPPAVISYGTTSLSPNGENTIDTAILGTGPLLNGDNVAAVEIHQQSDTSSDVSFDFELQGQPPPQPPRLNVARFRNDLVLYWSNSTYALEQARQVSGPWNSVPGASSPVSVSPTNAAAFYRLHKE
jgi:hypothetical protein